LPWYSRVNSVPGVGWKSRSRFLSLPVAISEAIFLLLRLIFGFVKRIMRCITYAQKCYAMTARTINVRLPEALYNQIEELAKATARTKSFLAIDALTHYVQNESWQIRDIQEGIKEADAGEFATDKQVKAVFAKYGA